jgi:lipopolysaccharide transport system permease protein
MWKHRELIETLTLAELKNKYQNTSLGFLWSILSPFFMAGILYVVFRGFFGQEKDYVSNLLVGMMAWRFFSVGTLQALGAFATKPNLITKVALPRQVLVLSSVLSTLIHSIIEFIILLPIIWILHGSLPLTVPLFLVIHLIFVIMIYGVGLVLASVFVYFRDANQIWEVFLSMLMFCSPIFYPLSIISEGLLKYYLVNPITQMIIMYRDVMVAGQLPSASNILISVGFAAAAYFAGTFVFNKLQRRFAEAI